MFYDAFPSPKLAPSWDQLSQVAEMWRTWGMLLASSTKGGEKGVLEAPGLD